MLRISQHTLTILEHTPLSRVESKIIGEFIGMDTSLFAGEIFMEQKKIGKTYFKRQNGFYFAIGSNYNILMWKIKKRTPKSYVIEYVRSIIVVDTYDGVLYKFNITENELKNKVKRVFPLRRKFKNAHDILTGLLTQTKYYCFSGKCEVLQENGNFIVSETPQIL